MIKNNNNNNSSNNNNSNNNKKKNDDDDDDNNNNNNNNIIIIIIIIITIKIIIIIMAMTMTMKAAVREFYNMITACGFESRLGLEFLGFSKWHFLKLVIIGFLPVFRFPPLFHWLMVTPNRMKLR